MFPYILLGAATVKRETLGERLSRFIHSTAASIYVSHFLSAWGDRMWTFAVGVYLADLSPNDLRLVASYGFCIGITGVLMGAIIGDVIDKYPRLKGLLIYAFLYFCFCCKWLNNLVIFDADVCSLHPVLQSTNCYLIEASLALSSLWLVIICAIQVLSQVGLKAYLLRWLRLFTNWLDMERNSWLELWHLAVEWATVMCTFNCLVTNLVMKLSHDSIGKQVSTRHQFFKNDELLATGSSTSQYSSFHIL